MKFYATIDCGAIRSYMPTDVAYLLPASSWSRVKMRRPKLPVGIMDTAADCGGFVATLKWGDYRYTPDQYVQWLDKWQPRWAATMDYCCENEITSGKHGIVKERQHRTTEMAYRFWHDYRHTGWTWVPTIQGWEIEDYIRHAEEMAPLINEMSQQEGFRVGIGTLCSRASSTMIRDVVTAVSQTLPGVPLHLWGVKLKALQSVYALSNVVSIDSGAWSMHFGRSRYENRAERLMLGMTKAEHDYKVLLPRYIAKITKATEAVKQALLL